MPQTVQTTSHPPVAVVSSSTSADAGVSDGGRPPLPADVMRAVGHYGEDPAPASFEKELPFGGLGIGLKGGPNGIGRPLPGLGETSVVPGKKPPDLNAEIIRRDPVPDNATMTPRPVDVPRDGGRTSYRVELPDGGVTKH